MIDDTKHTAATAELASMLRSIGNDAESWWSMGKMRCRKKLANGYVVVVTITETATQSESVAGSK